jgi:hypothetical protein
MMSSKLEPFGIEKEHLTVVPNVDLMECVNLFKEVSEGVDGLLFKVTHGFILKLFIIG